MVVRSASLLELRRLGHPAPPVGYVRADATELFEVVVALAQATAQATVLPPRRP